MSDTPAHDDPIFAAIAAHRSAYAAFVAAAVDARSTPSSRSTDAEREALERLASTTPTTVAGAAAALRYLIKHDAAGHGRLSEFFPDELFACLTRVAEGLEAVAAATWT